MTIALRNFVDSLVDSWPALAVASLLALSLSLGGVRVAAADSHEGAAAAAREYTSAADEPQLSRSIGAVVADEGAQCQAGPRGEANLRAEYARKMEAVKRRLAEQKRGDGGVITLNARGHNYGPPSAPTLPLDARPAAPAAPGA